MEIGSYESKGIKFQSNQIKKVWRYAGQHCTQSQQQFNVVNMLSRVNLNLEFSPQKKGYVHTYSYACMYTYIHEYIHTGEGGGKRKK